MGVDYLGIVLVMVATTVWTRAAEIDGRHAVADHPWIWGLFGGAWTAACRFLWGFGVPAIALSQVVVVLCMAAAITARDLRRAKEN
jgi:uncharacterized membrane protein YdcZ (DUF606 family)